MSSKNSEYVIENFWTQTFKIRYFYIFRCLRDFYNLDRVAPKSFRWRNKISSPVFPTRQTTYLNKIYFLIEKLNCNDAAVIIRSHRRYPGKADVCDPFDENNKIIIYNDRLAAILYRENYIYSNVDDRSRQFLLMRRIGFLLIYLFFVVIVGGRKFSGGKKKKTSYQTLRLRFW